MIFFGLLLIASLFINGLYKISRHHIVIMPDGSKRVEGDLFKGLSAFIEQTKGVKPWQYQGDQLEEKFRILKAADRKNLKHKLDIAPEKMSLVLKDGQLLNSEERRFIEDICQVRVFINAEAVFLFLDMPKYLLPKWIRNPLISCVVCMASFWGSLFWWGFVYFQPITYFNVPNWL
jgi:hypothetical protein